MDLNGFNRYKSIEKKEKEIKKESHPTKKRGGVILHYPHFLTPRL